MAIVLVIAFLPASARKPQEFVFAALSWLIVGGSYYLLARHVFRDNPLAWVIGFWTALGIVASVDVLGQSAPFYHSSGVIALILILVPALLLLPDALRGESGSAAPGAGPVVG